MSKHGRLELFLCPSVPYNLFIYCREDRESFYILHPNNCWEGLGSVNIVLYIGIVISNVGCHCPESSVSFALYKNVQPCWSTHKLLTLLSITHVCGRNKPNRPLNVLIHCHISNLCGSYTYSWAPYTNKMVSYIALLLRENHHVSVVTNWYHFVAIAISHQPRPTVLVV